MKPTQPDAKPDSGSATLPVRVTLSRKGGWRKPQNTVVVSRPGKWGNPFRETEQRDRSAVVADHKVWLTSDQLDPQYSEEKRYVLENIHTLRGMNLACWCRKGSPCHADTLLALANPGWKCSSVG